MRDEGRDRTARDADASGSTTQGTGDEAREAVHRQLEGSNAGLLMSDEMGANAMAHGEAVDFDRLHEESLAEATEIAERRAEEEQGRED